MSKSITCWVRSDTADNAQCAAWDVAWAPERLEDVGPADFPSGVDDAKAKLFKVTITAREVKPRRARKKP